MSIRMPDSAFIEVTKACNQKCLHCFASSGKKDETEISITEIKKILIQLYDMGVIFIHLTGGEPLLRDDLHEILSFINELGEEQVYSLFTNGTLWRSREGERLLDIICQIQNFHIQVSLDGNSPDTYNQLRTGSSKDFHKVVHAINLFKNSGLTVGAVFTVSKLNIDCAFNTARYALEELGVDSFLFAPIYFTGRAVDNAELLKLRFREWRDFVVKATLIKKNKEWGEYSSRFTIAFYNLYELFPPLASAGMESFVEEVWGYSSVIQDMHVTRNRPFCQAGKTELCISADGKIYPCEPARGTSFVAGNVRRENIKDIWIKSRILNWFRQLKLEDIQGNCKECFYGARCGGGCRLTAYAHRGNLYDPDPICPYNDPLEEISHDKQIPIPKDCAGAARSRNP